MYILIVDFSHSDNIESSIVLVPSKAFDNIFDHHMDVNGSDLKKDLIIIN